MRVENTHVWSRHVLSIIVFLQVRPGSDAVVSGKMNPGRKGAVELRHTFHTPLFLAHMHTGGSLILIVGGI